MPRQYYAGLDWSATCGHDVAVVDERGQLVTRERISDDPEGVRQLLRAYRRIAGRRKHVTTGIEGGDGLVVAALHAAGQPVMAVNPTIAARHRALHSVQRRKSDRGDALLLAQLVRSGQAGIRPLPQLSPLAVAIRETARAHHHAVLQRQRCQARLRSQLARFHPNLLTAAGMLPDGLAGAQARALLAAAPTPARAARLTGRQIATVLQQAGRSRRLVDVADMLTTVLHRRPLRQPAAVEQAMGRHALAQLATLNTAASTANTLAEQLEAALADHPQAPSSWAFPGWDRSWPAGCSARSAMTRPGLPTREPSRPSPVQPH